MRRKTNRRWIEEIADLVDEGAGVGAGFEAHAATPWLLGVAGGWLLLLPRAFHLKKIIINILNQ
jgi:hypothetical protein